MVFDYAVRNNLIVVNPTLGVNIPETGLNENRALTQEEELRLLTAVREFGKPLMFIVVVVLYTGCRKGELMELKWRHKEGRFGKRKLPHTATHLRYSLSGKRHKSAVHFKNDGAFQYKGHRRCLHSYILLT